MTKEEFTNLIWEKVKKCPKSWRKGQSVFNIVSDIFGVARTVQFIDNIDCFYNDNVIDAFIDKSYERYCESLLENVYEITND